MRITLFVCLLTIVSSVSTAAKADKLDTLIMDYPHGEERILVRSSGEAFLHFGASPRIRTLKPGVLNLKDLYEQLKPYLQPNVAREKRPDPSAAYGMVTLIYSDDRQATYLIYNVEEITTNIFARANKNVIGEHF